MNEGADVCTRGAARSEARAAGAGVELQFSSVCVRVETRPRTSSHALHVSLGAVCLRERITPGTLFPVLVAPQVPPQPCSPPIIFISR